MLILLLNPVTGVTQDTLQSASGRATLDQMIGQMIMVGIRGTDLSSNPLLPDALHEGKAGGIILFEKNLAPDNTAEILKLMISLLQDTSEFPLFISIDQEGGRVNRLKPKYGFPESVTASKLGKDNCCDTTMFYADLIALTLKMLGININFAPVIDLCSNPKNPVIAGVQRCFSSDPYIVARNAGWFIDAHHARGILTTIKHFPGHGSSATDTHNEMTDVTNLWSDNELIPYKMLMEQKRVDAIMTAHIVHCNLDKKCLPATLSRDIVTGLLRDSMGFKGVVITDDMQMHAITKHYGLEQSVKLAIDAGVDILLYSNNIPGSDEHQAAVVHRIIKELVTSGQIPESRIRESFLRIIKLKTQLFPMTQFPG